MYFTKDKTKMWFSYSFNERQKKNRRWKYTLNTSLTCQSIFKHDFWTVNASPLDEQFCVIWYFIWKMNPVRVAINLSDEFTLWFSSAFESISYFVSVFEWFYSDSSWWMPFRFTQDMDSVLRICSESTHSRDIFQQFWWVSVYFTASVPKSYGRWRQYSKLENTALDPSTFLQI